MRRSNALAPLSRDHHHALVVAGQLRRVTALTAELARDAFFTYWEGEGREHLREEEDILLPVYGRYASPHHPLVARVLCEHITIRGLAAGISDPSPPIAMLRELGLVLSDHVRLEERSLFPLIEQVVPSAALERAATRLADAHAHV
jgi:hypothetical protein